MACPEKPIDCSPTSSPAWVYVGLALRRPENGRKCGNAPQSITGMQEWQALCVGVAAIGREDAGGSLVLQHAASSCISCNANQHNRRLTLIQITGSSESSQIGRRQHGADFGGHVRMARCWAQGEHAKFCSRERLWLEQATVMKGSTP